jgi:hypothetical protein
MARLWPVLLVSTEKVRKAVAEELEIVENFDSITDETNAAFVEFFMWQIQDQGGSRPEESQALGTMIARFQEKRGAVVDAMRDELGYLDEAR